MLSGLRPALPRARPARRRRPPQALVRGRRRCCSCSRSAASCSAASTSASSSPAATSSQFRPARHAATQARRTVRAGRRRGRRRRCRRRAAGRRRAADLRGRRPATLAAGRQDRRSRARWSTTSTFGQRDQATARSAAAWGSDGHQAGAARPGRLPGRWCCIYLRVRFEWRMAVARDRLAAPRPGAHRRRLLAGRLRGHPVDGDRLPDDPRLRALRRGRGVRQGPGEHPGHHSAAPAPPTREAANLAVNQTLMRSINTALVALLPVGGLLFIGAGLLGAGTLKDLGLVLFVGMGVGVSTPRSSSPRRCWSTLKEREPQYQGAQRSGCCARRAAAARGEARPATRPPAEGAAPPTADGHASRDEAPRAGVRRGRAAGTPGTEPRRGRAPTASRRPAGRQAPEAPADRRSAAPASARRGRRAATCRERPAR